MNAADAIIAGLTIFGAMEMSYVESSILSHIGHGINKEETLPKTLRNMYWYSLSWKNRLLFWTGFICMLSPFTIALLAWRLS